VNSGKAEVGNKKIKPNDMIGWEGCCLLVFLEHKRVGQKKKKKMRRKYLPRVSQKQGVEKKKKKRKLRRRNLFVVFK